MKGADKSTVRLEEMMKFVCTWSKTCSETTLQSKIRKSETPYTYKARSKTRKRGIWQEQCHTDHLQTESRIKYVTENQRLTLNQQKTGLETHITDPETRMGGLILKMYGEYDWTESTSSQL